MPFFSADFEVKRENGIYTMETQLDGGFTAYFSSSPEGFCDNNELGTFEKRIEFSDPLPGTRAYFHIFDESGGYHVAAKRTSSADGLENLRELGGYNTADGRSFVKYGTLFRSGRLNNISAAGQRALQKLKIKYVLDFRSPLEAQGWEDKQVPNAVMNRIAALRPDDDNPTQAFELERFLQLPPEKRQGIRDATVRYYGEMPFDSLAYRDLFERLLCGTTPLLFHCSAGKDRTGVAAALILLALGVPEETAVYDYLLTNEVFAARDAENKSRYAEYIVNEDDMSVYDIVMSVRETSIRRALDAIRQRYDSFESYFKSELDIGEKEIQKLKNMYLIEH